MQCTAIAFVFLLCGKGTLLPIDNPMSQQDIDSILFEGTSLYGHIVSDLGVYDQALQHQYYLAHQHLPTTIGGININIQFHYDAFFGVVGQHGDDQIGTMHVFDALFEAANNISPYLLFKVGDVTIGLIINHTGNQYVVFDSHSRDRVTANLSENGTALAIYFDDYLEMYNYLLSAYNGAQYDITPVKEVQSTSLTTSKRSGTKNSSKDPEHNSHDNFKPCNSNIFNTTYESNIARIEHNYQSVKCEKRGRCSKKHDKKNYDLECALLKLQNKMVARKHHYFTHRHDRGISVDQLFY